MPFTRQMAGIVALTALALACSESTAPDTAIRPQHIVNGEPTGAGLFSNVGALLAWLKETFPASDPPSIARPAGKGC